MYHIHILHFLYNNFFIRDSPSILKDSLPSFVENLLSEKKGRVGKILYNREEGIFKILTDVYVVGGDGFLNSLKHS